MINEKLRFIDAVKDITGGNKKFLTSEYFATGSFPIIDQGASLIGGYTNTNEIVKRKKPVVLFGDHSKALKYVDFDFCLGADGVKVLEPIDLIETKFLYYYLLIQNLPDVGYSRHYKFLKEIEVPLFEMSRQKHIAEILDKADALRKKDQQLLQYYDDLAQSLFIDMFGDPVRNEKGWKMGTIRDLSSEVKYGTSKPALDGGETPYLRMNNISYSGEFNFDDLKYITLNHKEKDKYCLKKGDLVFNRTNSKELVGKTAVYNIDDEMAIAGYLIRVRTNELANPIFISAFLNSKFGKAVLKNMCKNIIGMANINAQELQNIQIPIPPISLQNQFTTQIQSIDQQKVILKRQIQESENLFHALLQKAFNDGLN